MAVDTFAAGIMHFIMQTGFPPLTQATQTDAYYKIIATKHQPNFVKYNLRQT